MVVGKLKEVLGNKGIFIIIIEVRLIEVLNLV